MEKRGNLEVITGCMFSGKTEELIREVRRAGYAKKRIVVFNHSLDAERYLRGSLISHSGWQINAFSISDPKDILPLSSRNGKLVDVVAIDEAQFFEDWQTLVKVCCDLAERRVRVLVAGLNQDFRGEPFEALKELMSRADRLLLLTAICAVCGNEATKTQRIINGQPAPYNSPRIQVGGEDKYQARCRACHEVSR